MSGKTSVINFAAIISLTMAIVVMGAVSADAYRICTFKGAVVDHGWRSMTVKSNGQCAEVNVGWRTKYVPNRRPCLGEIVAVDFILEDGYMKATKVVSLSPTPAAAQCYPPAPPSGTVCRTVGGEEAGPTTDSCGPPKPICSTKPPAHVYDRNWAPGKQEPAPKHSSAVTPPQGATRTEPSGPAPVKKPVTKKPVPPAEQKVITKTTPPEKVKPEVKEEIKEEPVKEEKTVKTLLGEVVASSPKSLSVRSSEDGESAEVVNVKVGLKTKFIPFRRPAVGEKVKVDYRVENGEKFGYTVQVVQ
ncbi:MAG: hypothetical protein WC647_06550 [Desulfomonilaceae bacterium]|jgi:hypothetical protein